MRAAVIGHPIGHSLSPAIFSWLSRELNKTEFSYNAEDVTAEALPSFVGEVRRTVDEWIGLNVTVPHKERMFDLVDQVSSESRAIGAINVVKVGSGRLSGFNTDTIGVRQALADAGFGSVKGRSVLILGAGGAARAAAHACAADGASRISIGARRPAQAQALVAEFQNLFPKVEFAADAGAGTFDLIVQSTPLGMAGVSHSPADLDAFFAPAFKKAHAGTWAFDLIYRPERTPFLNMAEQRGLKTLGGLTMLTAQALATWEIWFDALPSPTALNSRLANYLRGVHLSGRIFLCGFMGAGKSTVGRLLAEKLGVKFLDTDQMVVERAGQSIAQIFQNSGEARFRSLESEAVTEACAWPEPCVVALGGGSLINHENLDCVSAAGRRVYLAASPSAVVERLKREGPSRPILAGLSPSRQEAKILELLTARDPAYQSSDFQVSTDAKSANDVSAEIARRLKGGAP